PALEHAIKKCLAKLPDERWQSASDLASELKWIGEGGSPAVGASPRGKSGKTKERIAWLIACTWVLSLIAIAIWWRNSTPPAQLMHFYASMPFPAREVALSPNGHMVAVIACGESGREIVGTRNGIWIYELGSQGGRSLDDTEDASDHLW